MTNEMIKKFEDAGCKRWTKGTMDRMYISALLLGLCVQYYKTGNVSNATLNGEQISNSQARRLLGAKIYVDINTSEIVCSDSSVEELAKNFVNGVLETVEELVEEEKKEDIILDSIQFPGLEKDVQISAKRMLCYLQSMLNTFEKDVERFGMDERQKSFLEKMCACKDMVEALIGMPVNLQKDGRVTIGF